MSNEIVSEKLTRQKPKVFFGIMYAEIQSAPYFTTEWLLRWDYYFGGVTDFLACEIKFARKVFSGKSTASVFCSTKTL